MSLCTYASYCIPLGLRLTPSNEPNRFHFPFSLLYVKMEVIQLLKCGFFLAPDTQCTEFQSQLLGTDGSTRVHLSYDKTFSHLPPLSTPCLSVFLFFAY